MVSIKDIIQLAKEVNPEPILWQVAATQAIHESRKSNGWSDLALKYSNWFGIKAKGTAGYINLKTKEVLPSDKTITVGAYFGYNVTMRDSFEQHRRLMLRPRYERVRNAKTVEKALRELLLAGYATDPAYSSKLLAIFNQYIRG